MLFCLFAYTVQGQHIRFQINSVIGQPNMPMSSLAIQFSDTANCVYVTNGLAIFQPTLQTGLFQLGCIEPIQYDQYGIKIYPQPIGNSPRIQFTKKSPIHTIYLIRCYSIDGKKLFETSRTGKDLNIGTTINTSKLNTGNYIFQIMSDKSLDLIQVIKYN